MSVDFRQRTPGELARMVWRRKWLIVLPTAAVAVAVAYVVWRLPNVYESTTLLTVKPASIATGIVTQLSDSDLTMRINNIGQEVTSRSTLEPLIQRYDLYARERARGESMEELVERMRTRDLKITLNTSRNEITNGFFLSFRGAGAARDAGRDRGAGRQVRREPDGAPSSDEAELTKEFFTERVDEQKAKLDEIDRRRLRRHAVEPSEPAQLVDRRSSAARRACARSRRRASPRSAASTTRSPTSTASPPTSTRPTSSRSTSRPQRMQDPKSTAAYAELVKRQAELESQYDESTLKLQTRARPR